MESNGSLENSGYCPPDDITLTLSEQKAHPRMRGSLTLADQRRGLIFPFTGGRRPDTVRVMNRKALFPLGLLLLVLATNVAYSQPGAAASEKAINARMVGVTAAWGTLDAAKITPFFTTDPGAIFFDLTPLEYHGAAAYITGSQKEFADFQSLNLKIRDDASVHATSPNTGWATATVDISLVHKDGKKESMPVRWTSIWQKKDGDWIIIHEHWSVPVA
jgi:ketosteroid isomerase-like protein